jgi:hypothetical protein
MPREDQPSTELIAARLKPTDFDLTTITHIKTKLQALDLKDDGQKQELINSIEKLSIPTIIMLSLNHPFFIVLCQLSSLKEHWKNKIKEQGVSDKPDYHMLPQANIKPFNLLCAITYTNLYIEYADKPDLAAEATECLQLAAFLGSFYARCILLRNKLFKLKRTRKTEQEDIKPITTYANDTAKLHGTPGHLLASYAYFRLGKNFNYMLQKTTDKSAKEDLLHRANFCYRIALQHFHMSTFLQPYSTAAINNAFFGSELSNMLGKSFDEEAHDNFFSGGTERTQEILFTHCTKPEDQQTALATATIESDKIKEDLEARGELSL